MKRIEEKLKKEKMKQVQLLATYYQLMDQLPIGEKRDRIIRDILACKDKIYSINQQLAELIE